MKGILFKPTMLQAIISGNKTVTRRTAGLKEINQSPDEWEFYKKVDNLWIFKYKINGGFTDVVPRYKVGEIVYIKEKTLCWQGGAGGLLQVVYMDDPEIPALLKDSDLLKNAREKYNKKENVIGKWEWRSPLFMFAQDARYFIKILDVRPERLLDITPEDCEKEGTPTNPMGQLSYWNDGYQKRLDYFWLWDSINGLDSHKKNPWVWRIAFEKVDKPEGI